MISQNPMGSGFNTDFVATYLNLVVQCGGDYTSAMLAESGVGPVVAQEVEFWLDQPLNLYSSLRDERCSDAFRMTQEATKDHIRVVNSNDPNDKVRRSRRRYLALPFRRRAVCGMRSILKTYLLPRLQLKRW